MTGRVGLLRIELPGHTVNLTDGGFFEYGGETYTSKDSLLGTIAGIEPMTEGKTGEIPALDMSFNIPNVSAITSLSVGALQQSTVKLWLAKYDPITFEIVGTPDLQFLGQVDQPSFSIGEGEFSASLTMVSKAEWFFQGDIGNSLSASFHKTLFPGETGHDNATGLQVPVAWGTESPNSSSGGGSGWNLQPWTRNLAK